MPAGKSVTSDPLMQLLLMALAIATPATVMMGIAAEAAAIAPRQQCQEPGWTPLEVVEIQSHPVINSTNLPIRSSFFGIEGGHMIRVNDTFYTVITEFTAPPLWVPSNIALWKAQYDSSAPADGSSWPRSWSRLRTLFVSDGTTTGTDCNSTRASLGSSAALAFDEDTSRWNVFYVGFVSCNDSAFVNRQGRIFRAVADQPGRGGIESTYTDVGVVLRPDDGHSQRWWEGTQGDDSLQPFYLGRGKGWASFYGSAGVLDSGVNNGQRVGLVTAPSLRGPWQRAIGEVNPVNLSALSPHIEQPMVTRLRDSRGFVAFFDALQEQGKGMIGYSFSSDGLTWKPECSQLLRVAGLGSGWNFSGATRTPQGAVELVNGELLLGFSAYDSILPPHYHLPSQPGGNWHESMGLAILRFLEQEQDARATQLPSGVISVTSAPWHADPSGSVDSTAALQAAFDAGAKSRQTIFIPAGRYRVTDTLNCSIDWPFMTAQGTDPGPPTPDWLFATHVIVGEQLHRGLGKKTVETVTNDISDGRRRPATLFVPPNTPGFMSTAISKYVIHFYHTGRNGPGKPPFSQPDININQILQGVDIDIMAGNVGAVGIMHIGAQGSSLEDVTVWAGDGASGIAGGAGGGGSHTNVRVVGGRFGLDLRAAQPSPTVTAATLIKQTCAAIVYEGRGPLTVVGSKLVQPLNVSVNSPGLIAAGLPNAAFRGECILPVPPLPIWDGAGVFSGSVSIIDTSITRADNGSIGTEAGEPHVIVSDRNVFLHNVFVKGFSNIVTVGGLVTLTGLGRERWTWVSEFASSKPPVPFKKYNQTFRFATPVYLGGRRVSHNHQWLQTPLESMAPPPDLSEQHVWSENTFPTFQSLHAVDAIKYCGAKGDGESDDYFALQRCVDSHDLVVLPKGFYRLSATLVLSRAGAALVGVGRTYSVLAAMSNASFVGPLLRVTSQRVVLFQIEYITFWHLPSIWLLDWQSPTGIWRQSHGYRTCDVVPASNPHSVLPPKVGPSCAGFPNRSFAVDLDQPLSIISGGGSFYTFYVEDWHYQGAGYRHLLVNGSTAGVKLYHVNPDCARGDAAVEIAGSHNVSIFGMKSEGNYCQLWVKRSENIMYTGFGGFASPFSVHSTYPASHAQYTPSMIRVEASHGITLANLWGDVRIGCQLDVTATNCTGQFGGLGVSPTEWSFVLWKNNTGVTTLGEHFTAPLDRPLVFKL